MGGRELAIGIAELDDTAVLLSCVAVGTNTVIASARYGIVDCGRVVEVDCLSDDLAARRVGLVAEDELTFFGHVTEACIGGGNVANVSALQIKLVSALSSVSKTGCC